ncbi:MAG TPA: response regulator [Humidesulfovibrio sp.]|uniref:sensor histidine kinase n=1 Tax=Humidesulfovibrio sp. TaxID=2910988 RepID=UPI002B7B7700|nr:response regulator [Humidesulfovibrio sp.]HWR04205.1 response regulator [Humidesulfovibrio sp.]
MSEAKSLLLVDDEDGIRRVLSLTLTDAGWRVRTAENAEDALALFRAEPAPVVLTDIKMPGMDGLALLSAIKALDPETEVILITGHGDIDLAIQGIKLDAADFVTKPIRDDALDIALSRARERRAMRRAIREHTEHLELLVAQKTRELLNAERLAAVGQTVAGLSHAIKNMASGLEGSLFLLRQGLDRDHRDYLEQGWEMLEANVQKLKGLSLDMLRFARPEELHRTPTDPALPARQVVELLRPQAEAAGITLELDAPQGLAPAFIDAEALHRCLLNLVGNALDACVAADFGPPHSGGRQGGRVSVHVEALPGGGASYSVVDNGCGIPEAQRANLFTAFFSTKGSGGSGLGLMTTKKTVEAHGGSIHITSAENAGSEFIILIPGQYENKVLQ